MILLAECVTVMKKDDVKTYQSNLLNLFLEALDFRVQCNQEVSYFKLLLCRWGLEMAYCWLAF